MDEALIGILQGESVGVPQRDGYNYPHVGDDVVIGNIDGFSTRGIVTQIDYYPESNIQDFTVRSYNKNGHKIDDGHVVMFIAFVPYGKGTERDIPKKRMNLKKQQ